MGGLNCCSGQLTNNGAELKIKINGNTKREELLNTESVIKKDNNIDGNVKNRQKNYDKATGNILVNMQALNVLFKEESKTNQSTKDKLTGDTNKLCDFTEDTNQLCDSSQGIERKIIINRSKKMMRRKKTNNSSCNFAVIDETNTAGDISRIDDGRGDYKLYRIDKDLKGGQEYLEVRKRAKLSDDYNFVFIIEHEEAQKEYIFLKQEDAVKIQKQPKNKNEKIKGFIIKEVSREFCPNNSYSSTYYSCIEKDEHGIFCCDKRTGLLISGKNNEKEYTFLNFKDFKKGINEICETVKEKNSNPQSLKTINELEEENISMN